MQIEGSWFRFLSILNFLVPIVIFIGWAILVVAAWRFMKAHEAIAQTYKSLEGMLQELAGSIKPK